MTGLDDVDRRVLDLIQAEFPLSPSPCVELGRRAGLSAEEAQERVASLRRRGLIRRIGGVINSRRLGLVGTLVGMKVPPDCVDEVAAIVNDLSNVTHNYLREDDYNMWFTVTAASRDEVTAILSDLRRRTGIEDILDLPSLRTFKINVQLRFGSLQPPAASHQEEGEAGGPRTRPGGGGPAALGPSQKAVLAQLQGDLPDGPEPYDAMAKRAGLPVDEFLATARGLVESGVLRRVSALVNHIRAGFGASAMCVWEVPPERVAQAGRLMAAFDEVTHCYQRPTSPGWPYALYAMVHGRTREESASIARRIADAVRPVSYRLLFSVRELKKRSLRPF